MLAAGAIALLALMVTAATITLGDETRQPPAAPAAPLPAPESSASPSSAAQSPAASPSPSVSPSRPSSRPPQTTGAAPADRAARLELNQGFDLDAGRASDGMATRAPYDIAVNAGGMRSGDYSPRLALMPPGPPPSREQCSALTDAQLEVMVTGLAPGRSLCVKTTQGRWARVTITAAGSTSYTFTYAVWS